MTTWEKRATGLIDDSMRFFINTMLFGRFDRQCAKDLISVARRDVKDGKKNVQADS